MLWTTPYLKITLCIVFAALPALPSFLEVRVLINTVDQAGSALINEQIPFPPPGTNILRSGSVVSENGFGSGSYAARAEFGNLGVSLSLFSSFDGTSGSGAFGSVGVVSEEDITFNGVDAGFLSIDFLVSGSISHTATEVAPFEGISAAYLFGGPNNLNLSFNYGANGLPEFQITAILSSMTTLVPQSNVAGNSLSVLYRGTTLLPFSAGRLTFAQSLSITGDCRARLTQNPCVADGDFFGSALVGGAKILDINQQEVLGASMTSASGFDYTAEIPGSEVPEPATFASVGSILLAAALRMWRSNYSEGCSSPRSGKK